MSPRVQTNRDQIRRRTPRIPKILTRFHLFLQALTKMIFIFDQSFFIGAKCLGILDCMKKEAFLDQSFFIGADDLGVLACKKKEAFFDQSFFISQFSNRIRLFRIFVFKVSAIKKFLLEIVFPQYYICFPTSVF